MEDFIDRLNAYQRAMTLARLMMAEGIISAEEYAIIDTIIARKYGIKSSELLS